MFDQFLRENKRSSFVILEIGAGPVQPLAHEMAKMRFLNDRYRSTLIRINPIKERLSHYAWEKQQFEFIVNQNELKNFRIRKVEKLKEEVRYLKS